MSNEETIKAYLGELIGQNQNIRPVVQSGNEISADMGKTGQESKKETVPKHGWGLKIIRGITERYNGLIDTEYGENNYRVCVEFPLF